MIQLIHNFTNTKIKLGILLLLASYQTSFNQVVTGPSPVTVNSTHTYYYDDGQSHTNIIWNLMRGTEITSGNTGTQYYVTIQWESVGTGSVIFRSSGIILGSKTVTIGGVTTLNPPDMPTITNYATYTRLTKGTPPSGEIWVWQSSPTGTFPINNTPYVDMTSGTEYFLRAYNPTTGDWSAALTINYTIGFGDTFSDENYIHTTTPRIPTTDISEILKTERIQNITYFDGLGRPMQNIGIRAGGNSEDIITHIAYDDYGRQDKEYLPYTSSSNIGSYRDVNVENDINQYYQTKYADDFLNTITSEVNPYSEKHFENSPLNRVLEQAAPGKDWALDKDSDTDHTIKFEYSTNTVSDYVRIFTVNTTYNTTTKIYEPTLENNEDTYPEGTLYKTITKDENWTTSDGKDKTTEEYKNKHGQVILKRTFNNQQWHDTYYVYDDFGNLTYVLPPKINTYAHIGQHGLKDKYFDISSLLVNSTNPDYVACTFYFDQSLTGDAIIYLDIEAEDYSGGSMEFVNGVLPLPSDWSILPDINIGELYFNNGNLAGTFSIVNNELKVVSSGLTSATDDWIWHSFVINLSEDYQNDFDPSAITTSNLNELAYQYKYDNRNRLVEKKIPEKDWEYIIYDKLDRPIWTQDKNLRDQTGKEWLFTKYDALGRVTYTGMQRYDASRASTQNVITGVNSTYTQYEERVSSNVVAGTNIYYSSNSAPKNPKEIYTINYYDTYVDLPSGFSPPTSVYSQAVTSRTKGLPTVSKVRVLDTNDWITTVTYYDEKARPIYVYSKNDYLNTVDIVESSLDFTGIVLETKTTHIKDNSIPIITLDRFEYDHVNRLLSQKQSIIINNNNVVDNEVISANTYDDLGQLISKRVGGRETNTNGLQQVDYTYNIRGWLKQINDPSNLGNDLFSFGINYNTPSHPRSWHNKALYNGNISHTYWKTNSDNMLREYAYKYDDLNRLTNAYYAENGSDNSKYDSSIYNYDKNGNIGQIVRRGKNPNGNNASIMDNMNYTYQGNQLLAVSDSYNNATANSMGGFIDGNTVGDDYDYDDNGNMTQDLNKGITNISYNHLNLPTSISINGNGNVGTISYIYDATGVKLKKIVNKGTPTTTEYAGNYVYQNSSLEFFNHPEGYVDAESSLNYIYQYKDHLGNVRLSYSDTNNDGSVTQSEIIEESNYYPFGLKHRGYNNVTTSNGNSVAKSWKYNGKELNEELGLQWHDFGARNYDASLGRWMNLDPKADSYRSLSPYNYVTNSPMILVDPNGEDISFSFEYEKDEEGNYVINKNGGRNISSVKMTVTGKVINVSGKSVNMNDAISEITGMIESSFKGETENGVKLTTEVNLTEASSIDDINESDHVFALAEISDEKVKAQYGTDEFGKNNAEVYGVTNMEGGKVAYIDVDFFSGIWDRTVGRMGEKTAAHEFASHMLNLGHTSGYFDLTRQNGGTHVNKKLIRRTIMKGLKYDKSINKGRNYDIRFNKKVLTRGAANAIIK